VLELDAVRSAGSTAPTLPAHKLLAGQKARVTGASSGIGRGVTIASSRTGADGGGTTLYPGFATGG
jgi:hypothetical protein